MKLRVVVAISIKRIINLKVGNDLIIENENLQLYVDRYCLKKTCYV